MTTPVRRSLVPLLLAALAVLAHLGIGSVYAVSGLAVPEYVVTGLFVWWVAQGVVLLWLAWRRSRWVLAVPLVGIASWFVVLSVGSAVFGWTA